MITKEKNKGNIPLDEKILNKYSSAREIFDNTHKSLLFDMEIKLYNIPEIKNINVKKLKVFEAKNLANNIFYKYHSKNTFINNNNKIVVNKNGINESIVKIYHNRFQRDYMLEHLIIFSNLGKVIENAKLVSQTMERKNRTGILYWNYYLDNLYINNKLFTIEFEVRSLDNGQNQYRIQRIEIGKKKQAMRGQGR